jgi:hypothetical protein
MTLNSLKLSRSLPTGNKRAESHSEPYFGAVAPAVNVALAAVQFD